MAMQEIESNGGPRQVDDPRPGFFELRLVRGGPMVAGRIVHENGLWHAVINGEKQGEPHPDPAQAAGVMRLWHGGHRITESLYSFRLSLKAWATAHDPSHPAANPHQVISLATRQSVF